MCVTDCISDSVTKRAGHIDLPKPLLGNLKCFSKKVLGNLPTLDCSVKKKRKLKIHRVKSKKC